MLYVMYNFYGTILMYKSVQHKGKILLEVLGATD